MEKPIISIHPKEMLPCTLRLLTDDYLHHTKTEKSILGERIERSTGCYQTQ